MTSSKIHKVVNNFKHRVIYPLDNISPEIAQPWEVERLPYPVKWSDYYEYSNLVVELGCGHGELLEFLSKRNDSDLCIGFELLKKYTEMTNKKISDRENAMIFKGDGYYYVDKLFMNDSIDQIYILFPDPWHKKRHSKRRPLVKSWFESIYKNLNKSGEIFFATDWDEYYSFVWEEISKIEDLDKKFSIQKGIYEPESSELVETHYYKKWLKMGRTFEYIRMVKI